METKEYVNLSISDDINSLGARSENESEKWQFWSGIGSGLKNHAEHAHQEFSGVPPSPRRTVATTFHELEWSYLIYPRFGKYGEEEYWIFNKRKLADLKNNWQCFCLDRQLCFLLSCFYKQTSAFMFIPLPWVHNTFQVSCLVWFFIITTQSSHSIKDLCIQGTSPGICHFRFLYLPLNIFLNRDL